MSGLKVLSVAAVLGSALLGGCSVEEADEGAMGSRDNLSTSSASCTINEAPATKYYESLSHTVRGLGSLEMHRALSLEGKLSTRLGDKTLKMDLYLLPDGSYVGGYAEGRATSPNTLILDTSVVLKGTWKVECEKLRLSGLGVAEPFETADQVGIRVTMDRDLASPGLKETPRVLLRLWSSTAPSKVEESYTLPK